MIPLPDSLRRPPERGEAVGIGLISGSSMDGVDAAVVAFAWDGDAYEILDLLFRSEPYPEALRERLAALAAGVPAPAAEFAALHLEVGRTFGAAARAVRDDWTGPQPLFVASHGQTVAHLGSRGTLQLGDGAAVAAGCGLGVVAELRGADVALGGEGAPILPRADLLLRRAPDRARALLNLGGVANVTLLPPRGVPDGEARVVAADLGPGNALLDALMIRLGDGSERCDRDGRLAASGRELPGPARDLADRVDAASRGSLHRDDVGGALVDAWLAGAAAGAVLPDLLATASAVTARHLARRLAPMLEAWSSSGAPDDGNAFEGLYVAGGGARNPHLMECLRTACRETPGPLASVPVLPLDALPGPGASLVTVDNREAVDIAVLGHLFFRGRPAGLPVVTGAARPALLGAYHPPPVPGAPS